MNRDRMNKLTSTETTRPPHKLARRALLAGAGVAAVGAIGLPLARRIWAEKQPVFLAGRQRYDVASLQTTIADGLSAPFAGSVPFEIVQQYVDDLVLVSDAAIREAMILILERCKQLAEPGAAASTAALLGGTVKPLPGAPVVAVLSGGNVDAGRLAKLLAEPA